MLSELPHSVTGHGEAKESRCTTWVTERPRGDVLCITHCVVCVNRESHGRLRSSIPSGPPMQTINLCGKSLPLNYAALKWVFAAFVVEF